MRNVILIVSRSSSVSRWQRCCGCRSSLRAYGASLEPLVQGILQLRRMAGGGPRGSSPSGGSPDVPSSPGRSPIWSGRTLHGVGDFQELGEDGEAAGAVRWFLSGDGNRVRVAGNDTGRAGDAPAVAGPGSGFVTTLRSPHAPATAVRRRWSSRGWPGTKAWTRRSSGIRAPWRGWARRGRSRASRERSAPCTRSRHTWPRGGRRGSGGLLEADLRESSGQVRRDGRDLGRAGGTGGAIRQGIVYVYVST